MITNLYDGRDNDMAGGDCNAILVEVECVLALLDMVMTPFLLEMVVV